MLASLILLFFVVGAWAWLARVPFHEDEAIYAAWAFAITRGDLLLWVTPIDKPPLTLYPLAALIALGAQTEWLLRLPSFFWGLLAIWAVGRVAANLGRDKWFARALLLCSPLWWAMWASTFTDMAAVALALLALQSGETTGNGRNGEERKGTERNDRNQKGKEQSGRGGSSLRRPVKWNPSDPPAAYGMAHGMRGRAKGRGRLSLDPIFRLGNGQPHETTNDGGLETPPSSSWFGNNPNLQERPIGAILRGMALAGAILAKPTIVFLLPLFLTSPLRPLSKLERGSTARRESFWLSFIGILLLAWSWDASRSAPSWWRLGTEAYGTLGHVGIDIIGWAWLTIGALGLMAIAYILLRFVSPSPLWRGGRGVRFGREAWSLSRPHLFQAILITALFWIPLHIFLGFQPWERYLLPLVALFAILLAPAVSTFHVPRSAVTVPRSSLFASLLLISMVIAPVLAAPLHFAPQDRRWDNIAEIGSVIEALPPSAEVWYSDMGRPLAWYAKNTKATLQWGGTQWQQFPDCAPNRYMVAHLRDPLPSPVTMVETRGQFGLWICSK